ncbi:hypothetical protein FNF27_03875 [Cafeteria roenbergensis]|uniref:non-specific serine/threonine protein kinase n=1 Tax=Cafeteria roenbergensis TaxID=33653 RepID=A0A5A8EB25_CAFRO|nr:hypothetical protein FNF27_03875 [Cafeteria roenbergensis]
MASQSGDSGDEAALEASGPRPSTLDDFDVLERLGRGSFGAVFRARRHADGAQYVIKKIDIHDMPPAEQLGAAREAQIMAALDHPHVVRYFDSFVDGGVLCIVMELCRGGDLQAWLKQRDGRALPERTVWRVFLELCLALHYLHSQRVLHRDLKTANVFLVDPVDDGSPAEPARRGAQRGEAEEGGDIAPVAEPAAEGASAGSGGPPAAGPVPSPSSSAPEAVAGQGSGAGPRVSVKIGDLGVARVLGSQTHFARTCVGTPFYLSPELVNGAEYDGRSDVWALGCILYELCTLRHPFDARNQGALIFKIMQGRYPALPEGRYSADLAGLVDRLLPAR